jgi:hypothetical protein
MRYGDGKSPSVRVPAQIEKRTTLALSSDELVNELRVDALIEVDHEALRGAVNRAGALAGLPVSLVLQAQTGLVKSTSWRHRESLHATSLRRCQGGYCVLPLSATLRSTQTRVYCNAVDLKASAPDAD